MRYYLIAGEASGDLHGSNLIHGIRKADPEAVSVFGAATKWLKPEVRKIWLCTTKMPHLWDLLRCYSTCEPSSGR